MREREKNYTFQSRRFPFFDLVTHRVGVSKLSVSIGFLFTLA